MQFDQYFALLFLLRRVVNPPQNLVEKLQPVATLYSGPADALN